MVDLEYANDMIVYNQNVMKVQTQELISPESKYPVSPVFPPISSTINLVGALGANAED